MCIQEYIIADPHYTNSDEGTTKMSQILVFSWYVLNKKDSNRG